MSVTTSLFLSYFFSDIYFSSHIIRVSLVLHVAAAVAAFAAVVPLWKLTDRYDTQS